MSLFNNGLRTSVMGLMTGLLQASVVMAFANTIGALGAFAAMFLMTMSISGLTRLANNMNYWGIVYTIGWAFGFLLLGSQGLSAWEYYATGGILAYFLSKKLLNKL